MAVSGTQSDVHVFDSLTPLPWSLRAPWYRRSCCMWKPPSRQQWDAMPWPLYVCMRSSQGLKLSRSPPGSLPFGSFRSLRPLGRCNM